MSRFSITIGHFNTWTDWHLTPKIRPHVAQPNIQTRYVDVPGANGSLDMTTSQTGSVTFSNRVGQWDFYVETDYIPWIELYTTILNSIHGKNLPVVLESDPLFYYEGRISIAGWSTGKDWSTISFSYNLMPYKKLISGALRNWIWDTFDLDFGIIKEYRDIVVDDETSVNVVGATIEAFPIIESSISGIVVSKDDVSVTLSQGKNEIHEFKIEPGNNVLVFTGEGTVSIDFEGSCL